jgi:L-asparagine transporter-like permease
MKGLSLPIEMIVIIAVAMLVLVVISAFFMGGVSGPTNQINIENAFSTGCNSLRAQGCSNIMSSINVPGFKQYGNGLTTTTKISEYNVNMDLVCQLKFGLGKEEQCRVACGCPVS